MPVGISTDPDPPSTAKPPGEGWPHLKEVVCSVVALGITGVGLWLLSETFWIAGTKVDVEAYARQTNVLGSIMGLLGSVAGYYFGRVPAERQAQAAEAGQRTAEKKEEQTRQFVKASLTPQTRALTDGSSDDLQRRVDVVLNGLR